MKRWSYVKLIVYGRRCIQRIWLSNAGKWQWLSERPVKLVALNKLLWRESVPSLSFFVMLSLSSVISTFGLLAGSSPTVIGAMIIAPLMGPIMGIGYSLTVANRRLLKRAAMTLLLGTLATVVSAIAITLLIHIRTVNTEILSRSQPTLIDLGVALAAGAAGAFAKSRRHVANSFPGVAVAVALLPPLNIVGIGIALGRTDIWPGAMLLFVTNLIATVFSSISVFLLQQYGSIEKAQRGLTLSLIMLIILGVPLGISLRRLRLQSNIRQQTSELIQSQSSVFANTNIQRLTVIPQNRHGDSSLRIELEVTALPDTIQLEHIDEVRTSLEDLFNQPVVLDVSIIPVQQFESTSD